MDGLELPARLVTKAKIKKSGFTDNQLAKILVALAPARTADHPMRVEWFWCVLCLMFTGARRAEMVQLLRTDIKEIDGVWCCQLEESQDEDDVDNKKELKNAPSRRVVPIHSQLIEAGFLQWVEREPSKGRLFPYLWEKGAAKASHWFSYLLKASHLKTPSLSLHSYRHTMTVKLELAKTHYSLMRRLLGHAIGNDVESRVYLGSLTYGVKELADAINAVRFPPLPEASSPTPEIK